MQFYCDQCGAPILADERSYALISGEHICEDCYLYIGSPFAENQDQADRNYSIQSRFQNLDDAREE